MYMVFWDFSAIIMSKLNPIFGENPKEREFCFQVLVLPVV